MSSDRRENPEQIPSSNSQGQIEARVSEQARIGGERKEVDFKDYPKAAALAQILKDFFAVSCRQEANSRLCGKSKTAE